MKRFLKVYLSDTQLEFLDEMVLQLGELTRKRTNPSLLLSGLVDKWMEEVLGKESVWGDEFEKEMAAWKEKMDKKGAVKDLLAVKERLKGAEVK